MNKKIASAVMLIALPVAGAFAVYHGDTMARTEREYRNKIQLEQRIVKSGDTCWDYVSKLPGDSRYWVDLINSESRRRLVEGEDVNNCNSLMPGDRIYVPVLKDVKKQQK